MVLTQLMTFLQKQVMMNLKVTFRNTVYELKLEQHIRKLKIDMKVQTIKLKGISE